MVDDDLEPFRLPNAGDGLDAVVDAVLAMPEHEHLVDNDIDVAFLFRNHEKFIGGRFILGTTYEPSVQGSLRDVFEWMVKRLLGRVPQFLVVLDASYWNASNERKREILVFHELSSIQQKVDKYGAPRFNMDGLPVYGIAAHDVEEFTSVVRRYGAWNESISDFIAAASGGN